MPTYILIVRGAVWDRYLRPGSMISAEFVPARFANYLLLHTGDDAGPLRQAVYHEYTHFYLNTHLRGVIPLWFDEGMAQFMEATSFNDGTATVGSPNFSYVPKLLPLGELLRIDKKSRKYLSTWTYSVHLLSWAMVHRALLDEPGADSQLFSYLRQIDEGTPIDEAVKASFGITTEELDQEIRLYLEQIHFRLGRIQIETGGIVPAGGGRPLSDVDALVLLARVMFDTGFHPERLGEVIAAAEKRSPDSTEVQVLKVRLQARWRDYAALDRIVRELAPRLTDPQMARGVGFALFERSSDARPDDLLSAARRLDLRERGMQLLDRALRANPDDPEAAWAFGLLAASTNQQLETALKHLLTVSKIAPDNPDIAMAIAQLYEAGKQSEEMLPWLQKTARFSHSTEQRLWARRKIEGVELEIQKK
jgi:tetratricopeptide (TPR) repeat protein